MQEIEDGGSAMTEAQMRDAKVPTVGSVEEVTKTVCDKCENELPR